MKGTKLLEIRQEGFGSLFSTRQGTLLFRNKQGQEKKYPLFEQEIGSIVLRTGGLASIGALATCSFYSIPIIIETSKGHPVGVLRSLDDDGFVETRIKQYQALDNGKAEKIARTLISSKAQAYDLVLRKFGLKTVGFVDTNSIQSSDFPTLRRKLMSLESKFSKRYFDQIFQLFNEEVRPESRKTYLAHDGINNAFNLAYSKLRWKCHVAILQSHLEPSLGFLHSFAYTKPSLVLDFMEIYRYLVDDLIIGFCKDIQAKDFVFKTEKHGTKQGKRQYLNKRVERLFTERLDKLFQTIVQVPRVRVGKKQEVESLINEEASLLARYIRNERTDWQPRIPELP